MDVVGDFIHVISSISNLVMELLVDPINYKTNSKFAFIFLNDDIVRNNNHWCVDDKKRWICLWAQYDANCICKQKLKLHLL